jgi:hypothetical protein
MQIGMFLTTCATIAALATFFLVDNLNPGDESFDWGPALSLLFDPEITP